MGETEDKFTSLVKLCKPTASQESKLRTCPLARESEKFTDSNSESSSEPSAMVMLSLPDSSNSVDQSTGNDDEFLTPPEQRFYSASEGQAVDCVLGDPTVDGSCCRGDDAGADEPVVENSGSGLVELKKNRVSDREFCEDSVVKKARVYEDLNSEGEGENEPSVIEISDSENEVVDEKSDKAIIAVDPPMEKSLENGDVAEKDEVPKNDENNAGINSVLQMDVLDEFVVDLNKNCISEKVSKSNALKVAQKDEVPKNAGSTSNNCELQMDGLDDSIVDLSKNCISEKVSKSNALKVAQKDEVPKNAGNTSNNCELQMDRLDDSVVDLRKNCKSKKVSKSNESEKAHKDGNREGRPCSAKNPEDIDKFKFSSPSAAIVGRRRKACNNGELEMDGLDESVVDLSKNCMSEKVSKSNTVKVTEGEKTHKDPEDIDMFKFSSPKATIVGRKKKDIVGGKCELSPSVKGKEKNVRTNNGLFMDLLEVLKVGIRDDDNSKCEEEVDFLETAKRRGIMFPKPRWWPAQGFEDDE